MLLMMIIINLIKKYFFPIINRHQLKQLKIQLTNLITFKIKDFPLNKNLISSNAQKHFELLSLYDKTFKLLTVHKRSHPSFIKSVPELFNLPTIIGCLFGTFSPTPNIDNHYVGKSPPARLRADAARHESRLTQDYWCWSESPTNLAYPYPLALINNVY